MQPGTDIFRNLQKLMVLVVEGRGPPCKAVSRNWSSQQEL